MLNQLRTFALTLTCLVCLLCSDYAAAMYDPGAGRFLQRDPSGYPDGMNSYGAYHVMRGGIDPSGMTTLDFPTLVPENPYPDFIPSLPRWNSPSIRSADPRNRPAVIDVVPGSIQDSIHSSLFDFLDPRAVGDTTYRYGRNTNISDRFYNNHDFVSSTIKEWFENGAKTYCDCSCPDDDTPVYYSGQNRALYSATISDLRNDIAINVGLGGFDEGVPYSDWHIQQVGSFTMNYYAWIHCQSNQHFIHAEIINEWSVASLTRNPWTKKPLVNGAGNRKVRMEITIMKWGRPCDNK